MLIRALAPDDDFEMISKIYAACWRTAYRGIISDEYLSILSDSYWVNFLKTSATENSYHTLVALHKGEYVGTCSYGRGSEEAYSTWGEIRSLYIRPDFMGKGLGKKLLSLAIEHLTSEGYQQLYLWVLLGNTKAQAFYKKQGFSPSDNINTLTIHGQEVPEIRYKKRT